MTFINMGTNKPFMSNLHIPVTSGVIYSVIHVFIHKL